MSSETTTSELPRRILVWAVLPLAVLVLGLFLRVLCANQAITFAHDEAQYVGTARDFLDHGRFDETVHSHSWYAFLPVGYPALIVATVKITGWNLHKAALAVNVGMGVAVLLAIYFLILRVTGSAAIALAAQLFSAMNMQLMVISTQAMTDASYALLFLLFAWIFLEYFGGIWIKFWSFIFGTAICFGAMFFVRISALPLLVLTPVMMLVANQLWPRVSWRRCLVGGLIFSLLGLVPVGLHSWRLYQYNGFFSISPQLAGNLAQGDLLVFGKMEKFRLDSEGRNFSQRPRLRNSSRLLGDWLRNPGDRLSSLVNNLRFNLRDSWLYLFNSKKYLSLVALALMALLLALWAMPDRRQAEAAPPGEISSARRLQSVALFTLSLFWAGHVLAYSLFIFDIRYMTQAFPLLIADLAILIHVASSRGLARRWLKNGLKLSLATIYRGRVLLSLESSVLALLITAALLVIYAPPAFKFARSINKITPNSYSGRYLALQGKKIAELAHRRGVTPRVVCSYMGVAYYSKGFGYVLPALEDDPERLFKYLYKNHINFVSASQVRRFGNIQLGVPLYYLMNALSVGMPGNVIKHKAIMPFFEILSLPKLISSRDILGGIKRGTPIHPGETYLLWVKFYGPVDNLFKNFLKNHVLFRLEFNGRSSDISGPLCPGPRRTANVVLSQLKSSKVAKKKSSFVDLYLVFSAPTAESVKLKMVEAAARRLALRPMAATLYHVSN